MREYGKWRERGMFSRTKTTASRRSSARRSVKMKRSLAGGKFRELLAGGEFQKLLVIVLSLGLTAGGLLDLGLVFAAGSGAGSLGGGLLAGGALDLLALDFVGDSGSVCHDECLLSMNLNVWCGAAVG
jgi:hypothetical protein